MSEERTTLEVFAPTVDEAVTKGLSDLGLPEQVVDVEILDPGSRGLFGLGSRQARIRLTVKNQATITPVPVPLEKMAMKDEVAEPVQPESKRVVIKEEWPDDEEEGEEEEQPLETVDEDRALRVARETVSELLDKMKVHARVTARYGESDEPREERPICVEVHGDDLSILIGRKSETLNALQYIASLIIGKELEKWAPVQLDIQGYRARRERVLRQLARRMAEQTVNTSHKQVLEPMPANERRIIHLELRDHPQVITESVGEEPNRKVTIVLKR
jgi:spoIIIJ-associated protein